MSPVIWSPEKASALLVLHLESTIQNKSKTELQNRVLIITSYKKEEG